MTERDKRIEAVENAISNIRLEGLDVTSDTKHKLDDFIEGKLTLDQIIKEYLNGFNERLTKVS